MQGYWVSMDEIPLFNWRMVLDGKVEFLRKDKSIGNDIDYALAYVSIYDSYIEKVGLSNQYSDYLDKIKKLVETICDYIISGDRFLLNIIRRLQFEINEYSSEKSENNIQKTLILLSKWMGQWIKEKEITASEYYSLIEEYGKANRKEHAFG